MSEDFNPTSRMIKLGRASYLQVRQRMIWFRNEHPNGSIETEMLEHVFGEYAIFKATVSWPDVEDENQYAIPKVIINVGHGSETAPDFRDYIEKAETKAIGRALAAAGYGTEAAFEEDPTRPADAPYEPPQPSPFERPTASVPGNATRNQVSQINDLTRALGLEIKGYLNGEYGVTEPERLSLSQATTVIEKLRTQIRERSAVPVN